MQWKLATFTIFYPKFYLLCSWLLFLVSLLGTGTVKIFRNSGTGTGTGTSHHYANGICCRCGFGTCCLQVKISYKKTPTAREIMSLAPIKFLLKWQLCATISYKINAVITNMFVWPILTVCHYLTVWLFDRYQYCVHTNFQLNDLLPVLIVIMYRTTWRFKWEWLTAGLFRDNIPGGRLTDQANAANEYQVKL